MAEPEGPILDVPQSCGEYVGEGKNLGVTAQHLGSACQILPSCQTGQKYGFGSAQKVWEHSQMLGQVRFDGKFLLKHSTAEDPSYVHCPKDDRIKFGP